jgi:hypothetical protein
MDCHRILRAAASQAHLPPIVGFLPWSLGCTAFGLRANRPVSIERALSSRALLWRPSISMEAHKHMADAPATSLAGPSASSSRLRRIHVVSYARRDSLPALMIQADCFKNSCTWCVCSAVPSSCTTYEAASKLPPSIFTCGNATRTDCGAATTNSSWCVVELGAASRWPQRVSPTQVPARGDPGSEGGASDLPNLHPFPTANFQHARCRLCVVRLQGRQAALRERDGEHVTQHPAE